MRPRPHFCFPFVLFSAHVVRVTLTANRMSRTRVRAVLFGPPGAGKTTQAEWIAERFDVPIIATGDLCRAEIEEGTALGKLVKEYVSHGMLAPDDVVNAIVQKAMKGFDLAKGFVLDGYPRNVEQAANLDRFAKVNLAIQLKLLDNAAVKRLQGRRQCTACRAIFHIDAAPSAYLDLCVYCGHAIALREYDHEEALRNRLAIYHFMTEPLAGYYRERGVLLAVNADQPIEDLFEEVAKKIVKLGFMG
jgi:adenylate kinase